MTNGWFEKMRLYKNTCVVGTSYALSVYLLKMDLSDIKSTFFICGSNIHPSIAQNLPHYYRIKDTSHLDGDVVGLLRLFIQKYIRWPFIFFSRIYAQDHAIYLSQLIGKQKYTLIPDGPGVFNMIDKINGMKPYSYGKNKKGLRKLKYWLLKRPTSGKYFGTNDLCMDRWVTSREDLESPYLQGVKSTLLDYNVMWCEASEEKKDLIKRIYNIEGKIIQDLTDAEIMLFTQPFMTDCWLTEEEMYTLYNNAIKNYEGKQILIKPHPRDKFDYDKYFPQCKVLHTYAPQQLLNAIGCAPSVVVTVCSSAISEMPSSTKKIYLGTKIHPAIFNVYGDMYNK